MNQESSAFRRMECQTDETIPSYPEGYQVTDLGPNSMLEKINHKLKNSI
jgi:hypothetical protein